MRGADRPHDRKEQLGHELDDARDRWLTAYQAAFNVGFADPEGLAADQAIRTYSRAYLAWRSALDDEEGGR